MNLTLDDPMVVIGLLIGGSLPFVVAAMTMISVGKAAGDMVEEIRRQFREILSLLEGKESNQIPLLVWISQPRPPSGRW